jgi:hypothetical protein
MSAMTKFQLRRAARQRVRAAWRVLLATVGEKEASRIVAQMLSEPTSPEDLDAARRRLDRLFGDSP